MKQLQYTGHPIVDVGVATITAFVGKSAVEDVTLEDMDQAADYMEQEYGRNPMRSYLTVLFPNSGYVQPAFDRFPERRKEYATQMLGGHRRTQVLEDEKCVFCGRAAMMMAFRQHVPLIGGEAVFNFYPEGQAGLPVCSACMLAIQAFPLGSVKCNGRALIVHSDCEEVILHFATKALEQNRTYLQMGGLEKMPDVRFPKTLLIEELLGAEKLRARFNRQQFCSLTAYHLTNYGTNADIDIYPLPLGVLGFLLDAETPTYRAEWHKIVDRGWEISKPKKKADAVEEGTLQRRNFLYEDLFSLPDTARRFLRTYFLRKPLRQTFDADPRGKYSLVDDSGMISWSLTSLFLRSVLNMDETRITAIQQLADKLAEYVIKGDRRLFLRIHHARRYPELSALLLKADIDATNAGDSPIVTLQNMYDVFEEGDVGRRNWSIARDLLLIRMIELMHKANVFDEHPELAAEAAKQAAEQEEEIQAAQQ